MPELGTSPTKPSPTYFFDTSAIVRLFAAEPGYEKARAIFQSTRPIFTSWVLLAEALGVLKRKYISGELSEQRYGGSVHEFLALIRERRLRPVDVRIKDGAAALIADSMDVLVIRNNYPELDAADAFQFSAIRNTFISYFVGESKTQLVTADEGLAKAAAKENIPIVAVNK